MRDQLQAEGIACQVRDHLSSGRGELPIPESWPTVWVVQDRAEAARAILHRDETLRLVRAPWTCRCGERNEGSFEWCWDCSRAPEDG